MKVLILCSGGDSPGMNFCIHSLVKYGRKHQFYASMYGFRGLIEGNFVKIDQKETTCFKDLAGTFIKSSRCPEFKTEKGLRMACKNIAGEKFDCVIVLGGDGSYKGAVELALHGINTIFIPATVDKDLPYKTYSIGFLTAVYACTEYIFDTVNTLKAFDRTGVFEVMGRDNPSIAQMVGQIVDADYVICAENINDFVFEDTNPQKKSKIIILQEKLVELYPYCAHIGKQLNCEVRGCVVGYLQRGTAPLPQEKKYAKTFAKMALSLLKNKDFNQAIAIDENIVQTQNLTNEG